MILADYQSEVDLKYKLFYQLTRLTRSKGSIIHDDRLDSLSIAVNYWVETLDRDTQQAEIDHRQDLLDAELEKFMESSIGRTPTRDNWITNRAYIR